MELSANDTSPLRCRGKDRSILADMLNMSQNWLSVILSKEGLLVFFSLLTPIFNCASARTGLFINDVLSLTMGASSSRMACRLHVFPEPPAPIMKELPLRIDNSPSFMALSKLCCVCSLTESKVKQSVKYYILYHDCKLSESSTSGG